MSNSILDAMKRASVAAQAANLHKIGVAPRPRFIEATPAKVKGSKIDLPATKLTLAKELQQVLTDVLQPQFVDVYPRMTVRPVLRDSLVQLCDVSVIPVRKSMPQIFSQKKGSYFVREPVQLVCDNQIVSMHTPQEVESELSFSFSDMGALTSREHLTRTGLLSKDTVADFVVVHVAARTVYLMSLAVETAQELISEGFQRYFSDYHNGLPTFIGQTAIHIVDIDTINPAGVVLPLLEEVFTLGKIVKMPIHTAFTHSHLAHTPPVSTPSDSTPTVSPPPVSTPTVNTPPVSTPPVSTPSDIGSLLLLNHGRF